MYMDFGTAMEISVVTVSAYGSAGSNTQIMMRVVSLEEELLDVPEYQGVPIEEWTTYLFHKEGQPLFRSHTCLRLMCEICPVRGYLGLQIQRFRAHSAWSLRSDGREHGGRGFLAGRSGLSAARMAKIQGNRYRRMRGPAHRSCCLGSVRAHSLWVP